MSKRLTNPACVVLLVAWPVITWFVGSTAWIIAATIGVYVAIAVAIRATRIVVGAAAGWVFSVNFLSPVDGRGADLLIWQAAWIIIGATAGLLCKPVAPDDSGSNLPASRLHRKRMSDDFETPSPIVWLLEVARPMCLAFVLASPFIAFSGPPEPEMLAAIVAAWGACFIRLVVRWFTRRDDPRHVKPPAEPPK